MAISLKHNFQSAVADGGDTSLVQPSNWNAEHDLTLATSRLIGRTSAGAGSAEEISVGTGLNLSSGSLAVSSTTPQVDAINTFTAAQVISVTDNSNAALRITQEGTGNAFVVEDSANPDSTPFVIDASGNVTTSSRVSLTGSSQTNTGAASILNMSQTWNAPTIAVTSVSGNGTSVTLTHAAQASAVPVGSTINVSGFTPSGYNTATGAVTASTTTTTTYTNSNTAAVTVLGQFQVNIVTPILLNITNTSSSGVPNLLDLRVNGTSQFFVSRAGAIQSASGMLIQNTAAYAWSGRGFLTSPAAGGVQLGNTDAAAPVAQTLSAQSVVAGTSNTSGVDLTIRGSRGTGTGAGGSIIFQTAAAGSSGTAQNAASERFRIDTSGALGIGGANYGTSGQALTSGGSGAAPTWSFHGLNLLGTITTTSGSNLTLTGLDLTPYRLLFISINSVSSSSATDDLSFVDGAGNSILIMTDSANNTHVWNGIIMVALDSGGITVGGQSNTTTTYAAGTGDSGSGNAGAKTRFGRANISTASTSLGVSVQTGFDAGSVTVYGVA